MSDNIMLWLITALLFAAGILRLMLDRKRGISRPVWWKIQFFIFPAAMLAAALLYQLGYRKQIIPVVFFGILEELILGRIRNRQDRETAAEHLDEK